MSDLEIDDSAEVEEHEDYPAGVPISEQRRAFILSHYVNAEIDINILLSGLKLLETYLETGTIPEAKSPRKLKSVSE